MTRPIIYQTPPEEQIEQIINEYAHNRDKSLKDICTEFNVDYLTFIRASIREKPIKDALAQARTIRTWADFDEMDKIANSRLDARAKDVKLRYLQWKLSKVLPHDFGERLELSHTGADLPQRIQIELIRPQIVSNNNFETLKHDDIKQIG
jgi:hypothetical protein